MWFTRGLYLQDRQSTMPTMWMFLKNLKETTAIWVLYYDNAPSHTALCVCEFLAKYNSIMLYPLSTYTFLTWFQQTLFYFSRIETTLKEHCFDDIKAIQVVVLTKVGTISEKIVGKNVQMQNFEHF